MKEKLIAIVEVLGILVLGWTLTQTVINVANVPPLQEFLDEAVASAHPDYLKLAEIGFYTLFVQFLCLMIPAYLITRLLHKGNLKSFGVTGGKKSVKENIKVAVLLFCLLGIPMKVLLILHEWFNLGTEPYYWELFNKEWTLGFWVFLAVGSYLVIPIFEELFYRGYAQYRLTKPFHFFVVPLISLLFILVHFQYFVPDVLNIGLLLGFFILSLGKAFMRYSMISIVGPIIIHALMNVPLKYPYDIAILIIMIIVVLIMRKEIFGLLKEFSDELKKSDISGNLIYMLIIVAFAFGMYALPELTILIVGILFILVVIIQIISNRKLKRNNA